MRNKKVLMLLAITVVLSGSLTACSFGGGDNDEDTSVVQVTPTPEPTKAPKATATPVPADKQDTTYTSKNKAVSIKLPDATWANKSDSDDMVSFESPDQGKLLVLHGSGDEAMSVAIIPSSQDTASALVKADNLVEGTDFEIQDYKSEEVSGVNVYSYTVHYLNDKSEYAYVVNKYFTDNTTEFYSVAGSVKKEDSLAKIKASVDSFKIAGESGLKAATPETGSSAAGTESTGTADGTAAGGTTSDGTTADGTSTDGTTSDASSSDGSSYDGSSYDGSYGDDGSSNGYYADGTPVGTDDPDYDTNQTRTIYRNSDGYPLVIYPNGDGSWCDDDGNTYTFSTDEDVYDENGGDYYYGGEPAYVRYMPKN